MTPRRYAILAAVLTVPAIVFATQLYFAYRMQGMRLPFAAAVATQLCHWELWAIAGPIVWGLERRWPLVPPHRLRSLIKHVIAAPLLAIAVLAMHMLFYHGLIRMPAGAAWFARFDRSLSSTAVFFVTAFFHVELILYAGVVALAHAARASALARQREHDALRLEAELTGARLTALRTQLQPHFLFNTLHTIGSLVMQGKNQRAVQLIAELGELLRATLANRETELTPLSEEIAYLRRYLQIEEARFGDRLRVEWQIDPPAEDALVPPFILQPVVENALRHGISRRPEDSIVSIAAAIRDGQLRVTVYNDGPPLKEPFSLDTGSGYGLKNVSARLETRRPAGSLRLSNARSGVRADLTVPLWEAR